MKIITANFLTCAVKTCKTSPSSFPLHFRDAELVLQEIEYNPLFLRNVLPRLDWDALKVTVAELGFTVFPSEKPDLKPQRQPAEEPESSNTDIEDEVMVEGEHPSNVETEENEEKLLKDLHKILLETQVQEGKLVCGSCGHEYAIKEGIANFLLPNHLV